MGIFVDLLGLAWNKCNSEIGKVIYMWVGMVVFFAFAILFANANAAFVFDITNLPQAPPGEFNQLGAVAFSMIIGSENAFTLLTFLAIVICLFEYAMTFTYVCYLYDDCSWEIPKLVRSALDAIDKGIDWLGKQISDQRNKLQQISSVEKTATEMQIDMLKSKYR